MEWLGRHGSRPTAQLIRDYLEKEDFRFVRTTYNQVGKAIVKFSNHYLEQRNWIALIEPVGPTKEKATVAMDTAVKEALGRHVLSKLNGFKPLREKLAKEEDRITAAKYLGKSPR